MTGRRVAVLAILALALACSGRTRPEPAPPTPDEHYLIETYVRIQRAAAEYRARPQRAESLLALIAARVDSARIDRTVRALDRAPRRWALVFDEIERRLRGAAPSASSQRVP